jgi:hypothetical protein
LLCLPVDVWIIKRMPSFIKLLFFYFLINCSGVSRSRPKRQKPKPTNKAQKAPGIRNQPASYGTKVPGVWPWQS